MATYHKAEAVVDKYSHKLAEEDAKVKESRIPDRTVIQKTTYIL